ncbi:two-component system sporulation sensor kinase A [Salirhabdus euzebyi]|uniref:histidine kinase n=1 Tax=Salirhabdus euzebyi TaxID=394506 RepID=A0A841PXU2_9BACI|nr:PAS domain S-box protein [Salirhabdus euzebyi]MBB6452336.1 two-component system sporulation sensor kinase A [Salirhabdus euzebyi]
MASRNNELDFVQVVNNSMSATIILNDNGIIFANPYCYELLGYKDTETLIWQEILHPEFHDICKERLLKVFTNKQTVHVMEQKMIRNDGEIIDVEVFATPYIDKSGEVYAQIHFRDITKRKRYEEELKKSEEKYRLMSENASDIISEHDMEGRILYLSPSIKEVLGFDSEELFHLTPCDFIHKDDLNRVRYCYAKILHTGETSTVRYRLMDKDKKYIWVETRKKLVLYKKEKKIIAITRDVDEQIQTEKMLMQSEKLALLGELSTGIVHEIKNPLTSIKGFLQLMKAGTINIKDYLTILNSEIERIESIAGDILSFAKPQEKLENLDITNIIDDVMLLMEVQASKKDIELQWNPVKRNMILSGDETQLKQVFINLIKNAIEATSNGGKVKVAVEEEVSSIHIQVIDNGEGIPADKLDEVGQSFFTTKEKGTGLGLMVTNKIVKNHHGKVLIDSEVGKGTTFTIQLPKVESYSKVVDNI